MHITYLGHAGFCVETTEFVLIMDPWLSPSGAFDSAWFQFPCNHHLAALVQEKVADSTRQCYIYISHEHKDHFDPAFLNSLVPREFTLLIPLFRRAALYKELCDYRCDRVVACHDRERIPLPGGEAFVYIDDSELDRDSAILVKADGSTFLNMNDCKLHDQLSVVVQEQGSVDVLACQFSGATWHPTCYEYSPEDYKRISRRKMVAKFEATAKAIEVVRPRAYLPSAGPCCFLDPGLVHLNFEHVNIFPRAAKVREFLRRRLARSGSVWVPELMPGDVVDVAQNDFRYRVSERVDEENVREYIEAYAARYDSLFRQRRHEYSGEMLDVVLDRLEQELECKLAKFPLRSRICRSLYVQFSDARDRMLCVDFQRGSVRVVKEAVGPNYYSIVAPSWEIVRVLDRKITWEDFSLTFRMRISREPDVYQTLMHGFLILESDDLAHFCARVLDIESRQERIVVEAGGTRYSVNRTCPHQGADLGEARIEEDRFLVCARHQWRFDLHNGGRSENGEDDISAVALDPD